jgi:hypothetical protein
MITKPLTFLFWYSHFITKWRGLASFIRITYIISIVALFLFSGTFGATKDEKKQCLRLIHFTGGTQCYNESWTATNGTFYCPQPGEPLDWTSCCGATSRQYCCAPKVPEKRNNGISYGGVKLDYGPKYPL